MVSVIVPVYRSEQTLRKCVESLIHQDYEDIEVILVVDGPPDGSGILAQQLASEDARIRVINQENQGVSRARNRGILEAKGDYIRFVDSDDYLTTGAILSMVERMEKDDSDLVIAGYAHLYFGQRIQKNPHCNTCIETKQAQTDMERLYMDGFLNMPWNKLYKRSMMQGEFPTEINLGEDLMFNQDYISATRRISILQQTVYEYIQDDRGTTLSTKRRDDKIDTALLLYQKSKAFFEGLYGKAQYHFLAVKVMVSFMDDLEQIGDLKGVTLAEKKELIRTYADATTDFLTKENVHKIRLPLLDYRIIYFFLKKRMFYTTNLMISLRTCVVKLVRKGKKA